MSITNEQIDAFATLTENFFRGVELPQEKRANVLDGVLVNAAQQADAIIEVAENDPRGELAVNAVRMFFGKAAQAAEDQGINDLVAEITEVAASYEPIVA